MNTKYVGAIIQFLYFCAKSFQTWAKVCYPLDKANFIRLRSVINGRLYFL